MEARAMSARGNGRRSEQQASMRPPATFGIGAREIYALLQGQRIEACSLDGKIYNKHRLVGVDVYDLILEGPDGEYLLLSKHSLKYVRRAPVQAEAS